MWGERMTEMLAEFIKNMEIATICGDFIKTCEDTTFLKACICTWIEVLAKRLEVQPMDLAKDFADIIYDMNK